MLGPVNINLEEGKMNFFCTCGKSGDRVLCNGSHKGSGFAPLKFSVEQSKDYYLCSCKKSSNLPYCDGSHAK